MSFKISSGLMCVAALALASACSSSATAPTPTPSTALNFNTTTTPVATQASTTTTGLPAANAVTQAQYDTATDTVTLTRTGAPSLTMTGSVSNNGDIKGYKATGTEKGTAIVAHTSGGAGYAVAFYDNSTSTVLDPQISVLSGGDQSTAPSPSVLATAIFNGKYLGYAHQTLGGVGGGGTVSGDATLTINGTGTGIVAGPVVTNRATGAGAVANIMTTGGPINGNLEFTNIPLTTTGLLGQTASGRMDGAFYDATTANPDGEAIGTILLRGGNLSCNGSGDITTFGSSCVVETGAFTVK